MKKEVIKVKVDQTKLPNKMHFEVQLKTKANVVESRKRRKPKYKKDPLDEY